MALSDMLIRQVKPGSKLAGVKKFPTVRDCIFLLKMQANVGE